MLSIRSLVLVSLSALSFFGASVQAQQSFAPGPQAPFWPFNPYSPQLHMWAAPMPMQPMPMQPMPLPMPFPTPFWLWPMAPQWPAQSQPATTAPPSALTTPTPATDLPPPQSDALPASAEIVATPSASEAPQSTLTTDETAAPELAMPRVEHSDSPPASASAVVTPLPTSSDTPDTPADSASLAAPVDAPSQVEPATTTRQVDTPVVKSRTATKKSTRKIRKLCWKDGRLDVCP